MKNNNNTPVLSGFEEILKKIKVLKKILFIPIIYLVSPVISFVYISQGWQIEGLL